MHQIAGHVHEAHLDLGARQPDRPDALSADAVLLEADDVLDAGTDIAMLAAVGLASARLKVGQSRCVSTVYAETPQPRPLKKRDNAPCPCLRMLTLLLLFFYHRKTICNP